MSWIESTTNTVNIGLALVILVLGIRILKTMRFTLQRGSIRLFILAALFFATKEVLASVERGFNVLWVHDIHELIETCFIVCLCGAMYLIVQSEKLEIDTLHQQVETDRLTGLMNLAAFTEKGALRFKHAQENGLPLTLIMLDLDGFKQYNDTFGHEAGNVALRTVALTLRRATRESDFIARYGGEEFILLLFTTPDGALPTAERIRQTIERECAPAFNPELKRALTASFGVSRVDSSVGSLQDMIGVADKQLYQAKAEGRNRVVIARQEEPLYN